ncbi:adenosylcobinamide-GDP ribazoletransferase [Luteococcus peritonei]|uniref:Adenosylcobinamide-GDP ribazoletransferase n=1 Tax=Luteococcus peritonei TaxID=88874 RepID=A0ABW4RTY2_9ACTN
MRSLLQALGMFTLLPVGEVLEVDRPVARRLMLALPWAGLVCGLASGAAAGLVLACGAGSALAAMAALATLAGITGAMHLDGVADTADGLASRKAPEEALALMKRSDIGPMGVATVVLVLLLQAAALVSLGAAAAGWLVAAAVCLPMVGRIGVVLATVRGIPGARPGGFGVLFTGVTSPAAAAVDALAALLACAAAGFLASGPALAVVLPVAATLSWLMAALWQRHLLRRLGGLTGDTFGSLVEVGQTCFVLLAALAAGRLA